MALKELSTDYMKLIEARASLGLLMLEEEVNELLKNKIRKELNEIL